MWVKIRKDLGGPFLEIVGAVFGKPKANGKGALNPEYEPLAPNRLRDRADFPEGEIHIRKEKRFSWTFFFVEECF